MINEKLILNVLLLDSKKDLSFLNPCVVRINDGNMRIFDSESELLRIVRMFCTAYEAKLINKRVDISLPAYFPYNGSLTQTYRVDITNASRRSFKVNAIVLYIIFPDGRAAIVNRIESSVDNFILDKKDTTTLLFDIDDDFAVNSVKQLYKTDKARIGRVGAKHPIMFAYNKMDMSSDVLSKKLHDSLMGTKNSKGYRTVAEVLDNIYSVIGHDIEPIQDVVPLDIAYAMNEKKFLISKYAPTINPVWFNIMVELGLRQDNRIEVSSILTTDRVIIPNSGTLYIHSPSDI